MWCRPSSWGAWSGWSDCSAVCGLGVQYKRRVCQGELSCPGLAEIRRFCAKKSCYTGVYSVQKKRCSGTAQDAACCSPEHPCKHAQGDCDKDSDCQECHVCGQNNCRAFPQNMLSLQKPTWFHDCCVLKPQGYWKEWSLWSPCSYSTISIRRSRERVCCGVFCQQDWQGGKTQTEAC